MRAALPAQLPAVAAEGAVVSASINDYDGVRGSRYSRQWFRWMNRRRQNHLYRQCEGWPVVDGAAYEAECRRFLNEVEEPDRLSWWEVAFVVGMIVAFATAVLG